MTDPNQGTDNGGPSEGGYRRRNGDSDGAADGSGRGPAPARGSLRMRLTVAALAAAGVAVLVVAALVGSGGSPGPGDAATAGPAVDRVIPAPGDEVLQQQRVGVVLDARYRLTSLMVFPNDRFTGGVDVSEEVAKVEGLNMFEFAPGEGRLIESLSPDANCVRATFVLIARPDESDTAQWCFQVS